MIFGIGVDLIEIERIKKTLENSGERFIQRVFTQLEIDYCESRKSGRIESYAARFAAKEAISKAIGCGIGADLEFKEIEIYNNEKGKPLIRLLGKAKIKYADLSFHLSLTHTNNSAAAVVVSESNIDFN